MIAYNITFYCNFLFKSFSTIISWFIFLFFSSITYILYNIIIVKGNCVIFIEYKNVIATYITTYNIALL